MQDLTLRAKRECAYTGDALLMYEGGDEMPALAAAGARTDAALVVGSAVSPEHGETMCAITVAADVARQVESRIVLDAVCRLVESEFEAERRGG